MRVARTVPAPGGTGVPHLLAAAASASLAAAASRPWGLGVLALVAYAPTFVALTSVDKPLQGAVLAGIASLGLGSVAYEAAQGIFAGGNLLATLLAALPYLAVGALTVRLRAALASRFGAARAQVLALLALPTVWATAEWLPSRPELLGAWALPLGFIGYSQVDLPTAQLARFGSVAAVSHVVLLVNACLALAVVREPLGSLTWLRSGNPTRAGTRRAPAARLAGVLAGTLLMVTVASAGRLGEAAGSPTVTASSAVTAAVAATRAQQGQPRLTVEVVQPNVRDSAYFAASRLPGARSWLVESLAARTSQGADLTVLPEAAWPGVIEAEDLDAVASEASRAFPGSSAVLFGATAAGFAGSGKRTNSAFLLAGGELSHVYAKRRLVPVGERAFTPGREPAVLTVAGVRLAPFVCYDVVFPSDARNAVRSGAQVLVVITDDAFAAGSDVPELHLRAARFRAIEAGVPVVLAANTGPSAVIEPDGRVASRLPALEAGVLQAEVLAGNGATPYVALGDWWGVLNALATGGFAALTKGGVSKSKGPAQALSRKEITC